MLAYPGPTKRDAIRGSRPAFVLARGTQARVCLDPAVRERQRAGSAGVD